MMVAALAFCGCGGSSKDPSKLGSQYNQLFASLDPETKACWDTGTAAMKTNGYAVSLQALGSMVQGGKLNAEQVKAVKETIAAVNDKMYDAVNKGDASARQQMEELRKATGR